MERTRTLEALHGYFDKIDSRRKPVSEAEEEGVIAEAIRPQLQAGRLRVVPDTTFLIRAHSRSQTRARRLLYALLGSGHRLVLSNEMIAEVIKVMRYPHFQHVYGLPKLTSSNMPSTYKMWPISSYSILITPFPF